MACSSRRTCIGGKGREEVNQRGEKEKRQGQLGRAGHLKGGARGRRKGERTQSKYHDN